MAINIVKTSFNRNQTGSNNFKTIPICSNQLLQIQIGSNRNLAEHNKTNRFEPVINRLKLVMHRIELVHMCYKLARTG